MKAFKGKLDISVVDPAELFQKGAIEREALALLDSAIFAFAEMASEELFGRGSTSFLNAERRILTQMNVAEYLEKAPADELRGIRKYLEMKLREHAIRHLSAHQRWN